MCCRLECRNWDSRQLAKEFEAKDNIPPAENILKLIVTVCETAGTNMTESRGSNQAWFDAMKSMVRFAANLICLAGAELSIPSIAECVQSHASGSITDAWWKESRQAYLYARAKWRVRSNPRMNSNPRIQMALRGTWRYWSDTAPKMDKPTSNSNFFQQAFAEYESVAAPVTATPLLEQLTCNRSDYSAADAHERGAIIILDAPIIAGKEETGDMVGRILAGITTADFMNAALSRQEISHETPNMRPAFIWQDEAQFFVVSRTPDFLSVCRSSRYAYVVLTQAETSIARVVGKSSADQASVSNTLQNLVTWITCKTSDDDTRKRFIGRPGTYDRRAFANSGVSRSRQIIPGSFDLAGLAQVWGSQTTQEVNSYSESPQPCLRPEYFEELQSEGDVVETIVVAGSAFPEPPIRLVEEGQVIGPRACQWITWSRPKDDAIRARGNKYRREEDEAEESLAGPPALSAQQSAPKKPENKPTNAADANLAGWL